MAHDLIQPSVTRFTNHMKIKSKTNTVIKSFCNLVSFVIEGLVCSAIVLPIKIGYILLVKQGVFTFYY